MEIESTVKKAADIEIIGPYPPPYGGVSVHIQRLLPYLKDAGITYTVFNQYDVHHPEDRIFATKKRMLWWVTYFFRRSKTLVHFHYFTRMHYFYCMLYSRFVNSRIVISLHDESLLFMNLFLSRFLRWCLKKTRCRAIIAVSKRVSELLDTDHRVRFLPAYVPFKKRVRQPGDNGGAINVFFSMWRVGDMGQQYGLDLFLELTKRYRDNIKYHFFLGDPAGRRELDKYLRENGVDNVAVLCGESLEKHLEYCDVFLRLNRYDAFGISIQEALDCDVPAVASDVCQRPSGAILFKSGDFADLSRKFEYCSARVRNNRDELLKKRTPLRYHQELIAIYQENIDSKEK